MRFVIAADGANSAGALKTGRSGLRNVFPELECEKSFAPCDGWKEVGHEGTIEAATIVTAQFENLPPPPYAIAYVRLDGAGTALVNFVRGVDLSDVPAAMAKLKPGARVKVAFVDKPAGRITDFHYVLAGKK